MLITKYTEWSSPCSQNEQAWPVDRDLWRLMPYDAVVYCLRFVPAHLLLVTTQRCNKYWQKMSLEALFLNSDVQTVELQMKWIKALLRHWHELNHAYKRVLDELIDHLPTNAYQYSRKNVYYFLLIFGLKLRLGQRLDRFELDLAEACLTKVSYRCYAVLSLWPVLPDSLYKSLLTDIKQSTSMISAIQSCHGISQIGGVKGVNALKYANDHVRPGQYELVDASLHSLIDIGDRYAAAVLEDLVLNNNEIHGRLIACHALLQIGTIDAQFRLFKIANNTDLDLSVNELACKGIGYNGGDQAWQMLIDLKANRPDLQAVVEEQLKGVFDEASCRQLSVDNQADSWDDEGDITALIEQDECITLSCSMRHNHQIQWRYLIYNEDRNSFYYRPANADQCCNIQ